MHSSSAPLLFTYARSRLSYNSAYLTEHLTCLIARFQDNKLAGILQILLCDVIGNVGVKRDATVIGILESVLIAQLLLCTSFSHANSVNPDQTAPTGAV